MQGKLYFTIMGLLLAECLLALLMAGFIDDYLVQFVVALWFLLVGALVMFLYFSHRKHALAASLFAFIIGFFYAGYISLERLNSWVIVVLSISAAGLILSVDSLVSLKNRRRTPLTLHRKKSLLEKELPKEEKAEVVVYEVPKKSVVAKKSVAKKSVPKKKLAKTVSKKKPSANITQPTTDLVKTPLKRTRRVVKRRAPKTSSKK